MDREEQKKILTMNNPITVRTVVNAPVSKVWEYWNQPEHITKWAFASDDWEAPAAANDLTTGGTLKVTMAAKDKSASFDLIGKYTVVKEHELIEYDLEDGRHVSVMFKEIPGGTEIVETFDPEDENPPEMQRGGWQAILDNFKKHAESTG